VHHLNYGIFLLSGVGAYLLLGHAGSRGLQTSAIIYGVGLALTFDEFGLWLHLGGRWCACPPDALVRPHINEVEVIVPVCIEVAVQQDRCLA